jgi:hypothetical protein
VDGRKFLALKESRLCLVFSLQYLVSRRVCSSVGQSTRLISVGSVVQVHPDPPTRN